jgi:hypothetical protein
MNKLNLLLIATICLAELMNAQDPYWRVYNYSNSGLPYGCVNSVAIDVYGTK